uniref:Ycf21 n=1 Tax=Chondria sp. (in: red algae) TaxID=1982705 RepID=A0A1Z1MQ66_9FLOR|nr:hypothetical protein [Chondria sp. (in: red algae)]
MNFNIYTFYKFNYICILPLIKVNKLSKLPNIKINIILILISEGSLTRSIEYLTKNIVYIQKSQKEDYKLNFQERKIRSVWMGTYLYTQLTFARSLWITIYNKKIKIINQLSKLPIGKSFIKYELDILKTIHELYYGYNQFIDKSYIQHRPIWGRKYTIHYKNKYYITIQEFFSHEIIDHLIK